MAIMGEWIPQSGFKSKADAHKVALELESIGYNNANDEFKTQEIVNFARNNPTCEIHKLLEWDDTIAAEEYRNQQARDILRYLKITIVKDNTNEKQQTLVRYFVNTGKRDGTYKKTEVVFQKATEIERVLENMKRDAEQFINRYKIYADLDPRLASLVQALNSILLP